MMDQTPENILELLIDYHLQQLPADQAAYVEGLIDQNERVARLNAGLSNTLKLLDGCTTPEPPEDLPDRIVQAVHSDARPQPEESRPVIRRIFSFRELVATAASIALIAMLAMSVTGNARMEARRLKCSANLGAIGQGITSYASQFPNQLPYVSLPSNTGWLQPETGKVRRPHLFLLVKLNHIRPEDLICPETKCKAAPARLLMRMNDFPSNENVSYSFQNLFGENRFTAQQRALRWKAAEHMAIMADRTPLLTLGKGGLRLTPSARSPNHRGKGQNVMFLNGTVKWTVQPRVGIDGDNIWQAADLLDYNGTETPVSATDSFLAP